MVNLRSISVRDTLFFLPSTIISDTDMTVNVLSTLLNNQINKLMLDSISIFPCRLLLLKMKNTLILTSALKTMLEDFKMKIN